MPEQLLQRLMQSQAAGHAASQSLHALRGMVSLQALAAAGSQLRAGEGACSRHGGRCFGARPAAGHDDPFSSDNISHHRYNPATHAPRPYRQAADETGEPVHRSGPSTTAVLARRRVPVQAGLWPGAS